MAASRNPGPRMLLLSILVLVCCAEVADANITIRRHATTDEFFFHGSYSTTPFSPADDFAIEIWNCAAGDKPEFIPDRKPLVVCSWDPQTGYQLADLVYAVELPGGTCRDRGRSCYFRDGSVPSKRDGIRFLRLQFARPGHRNRVWLESYGDLSGADRAEMMIIIKINGFPRASLQETFTPLPNDGWFSPF